MGFKTEFSTRMIKITIKRDIQTYRQTGHQDKGTTEQQGKGATGQPENGTRDQGNRAKDGGSKVPCGLSQLLTSGFKDDK